MKISSLAPLIPTEGVTGNMIDAYHDRAFSAAGVGWAFYGGNLWPQGTGFNPVPFDQRGKSPLDLRTMLNLKRDDPNESCGCKK